MGHFVAPVEPFREAVHRIGRDAHGDEVSAETEMPRVEERTKPPDDAPALESAHPPEDLILSGPERRRQHAVRST